MQFFLQLTTQLSVFKRCKFVTNVCHIKNILANSGGSMQFGSFTSPKSRIALQVARKIAPYDRALKTWKQRLGLM